MARRYHGKKPFEQRPVQKEGNRFGPRQRGTPTPPLCDQPVHKQLKAQAEGRVASPGESGKTFPGGITPKQVLRQIRGER